MAFLNAADGITHGWFAHDHMAWFNNNQRLEPIERTKWGMVIPEHDKNGFLKLQGEVKRYLTWRSRAEWKGDGVQQRTDGGGVPFEIDEGRSAANTI